MNNTDRFVSTFGIVPADDDESLIAVVSNAVRSGFAIVLCKPGEKTPLCILSDRDRNKADQAARDEAAAIGDPHFAKRTHACGIFHALTVEWAGDATKVRTKVGTVIRRLVKLYGGVNIGVELGLSRMLVVDLDTAAESDAFKREWLVQLGTATGQVPDMTVKSPGKKDAAGNWIHSDGGHFWFTIPDDVELPTGQEAIRTDSGWVAMWGNHQVLVPPSVRAEGAYRIIGGSMEAPDWLIEKILHEAKSRIDRVVNRGTLPDGSGDIDTWSAMTPWTELLIPDGWQDTGLPDRCSCPIFTAPGPHASPKSATAHDAGCSKYDTSPGHAPLHVWTDNPPDFVQTWISNHSSRTLTKVQYVAARDYEGDVAKALVGLDFNHGSAVAGDITWDADDAEVWAPAAEPVSPAAPEAVSASDPFSDAPAGGEQAETGEGHTEPPTETEGVNAPVEDEDSWKPINLAALRGRKPVLPTFLPRSDRDPENPDDGVCLFYSGRIHSMYGEPESGKSWIMYVEALRVMRDGGTVIIIDFENEAGAVMERFELLGASDKDLSRLDYRNPDATSQGSKWAAGIVQGTYDLCVIDGMTDGMGVFGFKSTDNDDSARFLRQFARPIARKTGAAVVILDHVTKDSGTRGRWAIGGIAKSAGIDGASYVVNVIEPLASGLRGKLEIRVTKDKPGQVRRHAVGFDENRTSAIGSFLLDSTIKPLAASFVPPDDPITVAVPPEDIESDPEVEIWVLKALASSGVDGLSSIRQIMERIKELRTAKSLEPKGFRTEGVITAIDALAEMGQIMRADVPGRGKPRRHMITEEGRARIDE